MLSLTELRHLCANQFVEKHVLKRGSGVVGEEKLDWSVLWINKMRAEHSTSWYAGETMSSLCLHKASQCCGAMRVKSRPDYGQWDPSPQECFGHAYTIEALHAEDAALNLEEICVSQSAQMHASRESSYFQEALFDYSHTVDSEFMPPLPPA